MENDQSATPGEVTITIKYGKGYDETWAVFRGSVDAVSSNLAATFGLDASSYDNLHDLSLEATRLAHAATTVASSAGGRVLEKGDSESTTTPAAKAESKTAEKTADAESEKDPLYAAIEGCGDVAELRRLWASNKAAFDADAELMAAWKTKGKILS